MGMCDKYNKMCGEPLYAVFRILVGVLFMLHGVQKLFGLWGMQPQSLLSLMGTAGLIETIVGLLIAIGLVTRIAAKLGALEMLVALFLTHVPKGFIPAINGSEPALLFLACFLILSYQGAGKLLSFEKLFRKKEFF